MYLNDSLMCKLDIPLQYLLVETQVIIHKRLSPYMTVSKLQSKVISIVTIIQIKRLTDNYWYNVYYYQEIIHKLIKINKNINKRIQSVLLSSFGVCPKPLATSLMHNHCPSDPLCQRLTLLSPPDTARMFPVKDQLTLHTTSSNVFKIVGVQDTLSSLVQITTLLSWEQLAIIECWSPSDGAQATSLTQSMCISKRFSSTHWSPCSLQI